MNPRTLILPLLAVLAVAVLLAVQIGSGGRDFKPAPVSVACVEPPLPEPTTDLATIAANVTIGGAQRAACTLGVSRERLLLALPTADGRRELAEQTGRSELEVAGVIKDGVVAETGRLTREGRLPSGDSLLSAVQGLLGG